MSAASGLVIVMVISFLAHVSFPETTPVSRVARVTMVMSFVTYCLIGTGLLGTWGIGLGLGLLVAGGFVLYPEIRRGVPMLVRRPLHLVGVAVAAWGMLVGLHGLGAPGTRLLRIPGATGLAPADVQRAVHSHTSVDPFADAGPTAQVDDVKRAIGDLLVAQHSVFASHGRLTHGWRRTLRRVETPQYAAADIEAFSDLYADQGAGCVDALHVAEWYGIYVDGDRALALTEQADTCGGSFKLELFLRRIGGRWLMDGDTRFGEDEYAGA